MIYKTTALKAQEQVVVEALIKYVEMVAVLRDHAVNDLINYEEREPAFLIIGSSLANDGNLFMTAHQLSPATLRQNDLEPLTMQTTTQFGITSVSTALATKNFKGSAPEIIESAEDMMPMFHGVGHA